MHSLGDLIQLVASNMWLYGGAFVLVLSVLVFIHEWGHYIVAVKNGVKVDSFSIGFGKEIWGHTDKSGTRWKVSLFPLGGYVKMFGDVDPASAGHSEEITDEDGEVPRPLTAEEREGAFFTKSVAQRSAIVFAGPAINYIFAVLLFMGLYMFVGQPITPPLATAVIEGSAADKAGFMPHDKILEMNNTKIRRFEDVRREVMIALDTGMEIKVERNGEIVELSGIPEKVEAEDRFGFKHSYGFLGIISPGNALNLERIVAVDGREIEGIDEKRQAIISLMEKEFKIELDRGETNDILTIQPLAKYNKSLSDDASPDYNMLYIHDSDTQVFLKHGPVSAISQSVLETYSITISTLHALGQMVTGTRSATELGGIIRIGAIAGDMAKAGIIALITFTALLSINLGLINLFPIPMLDGGHLVFYVIEAIKGSPLSEQVQEYAFRFGLAILVGIMLFANINDIVQLIS